MLDTLLGLAPRASHGGWMTVDPTDDYWFQPRGVETTAGIPVSETSSLTYSTVFSCINVLAQAKSTLPAHVMRHTGKNTAEKVDHPLNEIYSSRANKDATGVTFRNSMTANEQLWGNAYAEITEDGSGKPSSLWTLPTKDVTPRRNDSGDIFYEVHKGVGQEKDILPANRVLHIPGFSINGAFGMSPIALNRAAVALGQACVEFGSAYFGNGAWATGFITGAKGEKHLSAAAGKKLIDSMNEQFRGPGKAFGFGLLRDDMQFTQIEMPGEDAMFLGTRQFQKVDICGIFNVPLSKIQDLDKATFSNVAQQDLSWAKGTLLPMCVREEMAINKAFFQGTDLFFKFNLDGLMRGDFKTRFEGYSIGRQWGVYSINEVRAIEDMSPIKDGDDHLVPMNMDVVGQPRINMVNQPTPEPPKEDEARVAKILIEANDGANENIKQIANALEGPKEPVDLVEAFRPAVEDAAKRIIAKQTKATGNAVKRCGTDEAKFDEWSDRFYSTFGEFARDVISPVGESFEHAANCKLPSFGEIAMMYAGTSRDATSLSDLGQLAETQSTLAQSILSVFSIALNQEV